MKFWKILRLTITTDFEVRIKAYEYITYSSTSVSFQKISIAVLYYIMFLICCFQEGDGETVYFKLACAAGISSCCDN